MKVICDNCRAVYKIPDDKLLKPVNKATCRKCGHRMLIPRPRAGASPDEKTLVTAVPPTPPPAPGRDVGPPTTPIDDDPENTMPGVPDGPGPGRRVAGPTDDVPLYAATPMPTPDRDTRPTGISGRGAQPPAPDLSYAGATPAGSWRTATPAGVQRLAPEPARRTPAPVPRSMAPEIAPPQMIDATGTPAPSRQRSGTPAPAPRAPTPTPQPSRSRTPVPPPMPRAAPAMSGPPPAAAPSYPSVASAAYDPSGDMLVAVIGVSGSMLGALVLVAAFATTAGSLPMSTLVLIGVGMLLAFGGGLSTLLVILTGSRGRRPARPLLAMVFGGGAGVLVTLTAVGLFLVKDQILAGGIALPGQTAVAPGTPGKVADPSVIAAAKPPEAAPAEIAAAAVAGAAEAPPRATEPSSSAKAAPADGPVAETFQPRPTTTERAPSTSSSSGSAAKASSSGSSARVAPPPVEDDFLIDEPDPEPVSDLPASVPDDVIDTILRNNLDLKKCFFNHKKATGTLPARVTVSFQLEPSGRIRDTGVVDEEFKGTELDACLSRTIGAVQMPPSSGATRRVKYPFQLQ